MSNEDRQLLGPMSQRILRGDSDRADPSLATLVGVDPLPTKDRVQGTPDGRPFLSNADSCPAALEEEVRRGDETKQQGDQVTKPTNVFLPYICQAFGNAAKEYEKHKTLPCPKPAFDGWGEVNELMSDLATSLSATTGVEIVWDASPDAMINPLGEFGCFEKKETK